MNLATLQLASPSHVVVKAFPITGKRGVLHVALDDRIPKFLAHVAKVGPSVSDINEGDLILFQRFAGTPLEVNKDDTTLEVMDESDILAVGKDTNDLRPRGNRMVVKLIDPEKTSAGGVIIPDTAQPTSRKGTVTAVGPEVQNVDLEDVVIFSTRAGFDVQHEGETFTFISEDKILAKEVHA